jgi:oxygen-independent coproporphyrinogen-3 oxidase
VNQTKTSLHAEMQETMMLGLRLTREGVQTSGFRERFGRDLMDVFRKEINDLLRLGLLEWVEVKPCEGSEPSQGLLRLTKRGRLLGNQVFMQFVD